MSRLITGNANCQRMANASIPPMANQMSAENRNCSPMILWSLEKTYVPKNFKIGLPDRPVFPVSIFFKVSVMDKMGNVSGEAYSDPGWPAGAFCCSESIGGFCNARRSANHRL